MKGNQTMENELETLKSGIEAVEQSAKIEQLLVENANLLQDIEDYEAEIKELETQIHQLKVKWEQLPNIDKSIYSISDYFRIPPEVLIEEIKLLEKKYKEVVYPNDYYYSAPRRINTISSSTPTINTISGSIPIIDNNIKWILR